MVHARAYNKKADSFTKTQELDLLVLNRQAAWEKSLESKDPNDLPCLTPSSEIENANYRVLMVFHRAWEIGKQHVADVIKTVEQKSIPVPLRESIIQALTLNANIQAGSPVPLAIRENADLKMRIVNESVGDLATFSNVVALPACPTTNITLAESTNAQIKEFQSCQTLGDIYRMEKEALDEVNRGFMSEINSCILLVYGGGTLPTPVVWEKDVKLQAREAFARTLREQLYTHVKEITGIDLPALGFQEECVRLEREGVFRNYCEHVMPAQQERKKKGYLNYVLRGSRHYRQSFFSRISISNPAGHFNSLADKHLNGPHL